MKIVSRNHIACPPMSWRSLTHHMKGVRKGCLPLGSHYNVIVTKFPISGSSTTTSSFVLKGVAHCIRVSVIIKKLSNQLLCYWHLIKPKQLHIHITSKYMNQILWLNWVVINQLLTNVIHPSDKHPSTIGWPRAIRRVPKV